MTALRPVPWSPRHIPTIWVDYTTGQGYTDNGQRVRTKIGENRKNPNLTDMLDTAAFHNAERIMFTGKVPKSEQGDRRHWLLVRTPGWKANGHWLKAPVTGRFIKQNSNQAIEVRTAAEWFGDSPLTPRQALEAWELTAHMVDKAATGAKLFKSPAATGTNLWAMSLPRDLNPEFVTADIAQELHYTSGQHHIEHLVEGEAAADHEDCVPLIKASERPTIDELAVIDGRFMYAALCRELGVGPGVRLNREATNDLLDRDPYVRARVLVKFKVPDDWAHVGLLPMYRPQSAGGWYFPNRAGAIGETWVDSSELFVARKAGWILQPIEAVAFHKARPLDTLAARMVRAREHTLALDDIDYDVRAAVAAALRAIMLQAIGAFFSRGRPTTQVVWSANDVPPAYLDSVKRQGEAFIYTVPQDLGDKARPYYRPELAAQVWGRGRAKILDGAGANGARTGALAVPGHTLVGLNGDAIYTTQTPQWALGDDQGGADDGRVGRLRLQGAVQGRFQTPVTLHARDLLKKRAERNGPADGASFVEARLEDD